MPLRPRPLLATGLLLAFALPGGAKAADVSAVTSVTMPGPALEAGPTGLALKQRLAEWLLLTGPGMTGLPPSRYAAFLQLTPQWPLRQRIFWRFQNALSGTTDTATLDTFCPLFPLSLPAAFLNCASHLRDPSAEARRLWTSGVPLTVEQEQAIALQVARDLTPDDEWSRYEALERRGLFSDALRQIARLPSEGRALAQARLAERMATPDADAMFNALPDAERADPTLVRLRLRALRRGDRLDEALDLWKAQGALLQQAAPSHDWLGERLSLARALLLAGQVADAAALANDTTLPPDTTDAQDAALLSGFIALRELGTPKRAAQFFLPLESASSIQMRARGYYWTGRAFAASGETARATAEFRNAASFPTTFPGQRAIAALSGDDAILVSGHSSPAFNAAFKAALAAIAPLAPGALARTDLLSAASALIEAGDRNNAREFMLMLGVVNPSPAGQKAVADEASKLGLPAPEVFASYALARKGYALYPQGYPEGYSDAYPDVSNVPPGLLPAIIRQESGFDPEALSAAHAVGLLQLLPAAARDVARKAHLRGLNVSAEGLLDPRTNLTVGNAYVSQLLERFGGVIPYALAAYNAGPHRVDLWLKANPPSEPLTDDGVLDWIERLPYRETRLYIENIEAGMMIYRVRNSRAG